MKDNRITKLKILVFAVKQYRAYLNFLKLTDEQRLTSKIPAQFRDGIINLGLTIIKMGQILSTRPDLLPEPYIKALEVLQEHVPSFEYTEVANNRGRTQ